MGCPFLISGGISSILSLPERVLIVFHQSLLESFPDVISSKSLILYSFFCFPQGRDTFVSKFSKFFPSIRFIHFFSMFMGTFSFPYNFSNFIIDPRWIQGS